MRRFALLLALLALAPAAAHAQERAALTVFLSDTAGRPVPGVRVRLNGLGAGATSDSAGVAQVEGIPLGARLVLMNHPGYEPEQALLQFPSANHFRLRVTLAAAPITLDTLAVQGRRMVLALHQNGFYQRQREGIGQHLAGAEMDEIARSSPDLSRVFNRMRGFSVDRGTVGTPFVLRNRRGESGFNSNCVPAVRVDGVRSDMQELSTLPPDQVQAVEVYTGAAGTPPEYAIDADGCGLVLVWLKTG